MYTRLVFTVLFTVYAILSWMIKLAEPIVTLPQRLRKSIYLIEIALAVMTDKDCKASWHNKPSIFNLGFKLTVMYP